jgi:predicted ATPase
LLRDHRLVTLTGSGGIGKTGLALEIGAALEERFPDGVWFVPLERLTVPDLVAEAIAGALQLTLPDDRSAAGSVAVFLKGKRLLLMLDNAEHLVAEVAGVVMAILADAATVTLLVTSREVLGVPDEHVFRVPGLGLPDAGMDSAPEAAQFPALRLFAERAEAVLGHAAFTAEAIPHIAEICRQLDGIPLAIELAATRMNLLAPAELLAGLADRFRILGKGNRAPLARHQTLRAAIDWSHDLLSEAERVLFRRLSVFGGSFTIEGAAAVASGEPIERGEVFDLLASLVDKSLVVPVPAAGARRFRLLESTRAYARERLESSGETACVRLMAEHLIARFAVADDAYQTMPSHEWLAIYEPDLESVRVALAWGFGPGGVAALAVDLVSRTRAIWEELSLLPERRRWFGLAAGLLDDATPPGIAARIHSGLCEGDFGNPRDLERALTAVRLLRDTDDQPRLAFALMQLATSLVRPGKVGEAEPHYQEALALLRPLGRTKFLSSLLSSLAVSRVFAGDLSEARGLMEESLSVARATGFGRHVELLQSNLAETAFLAGDTAEAIRRARENQVSCRRSGNLRILAATSQGLAGFLLASGEAEGARAAAREALRLHLALGRVHRAAECIEHLALAAAITADIEDAARLAGFGTAYYAAAGRVREPIEQKGRDRLQTLLHAGLAAPDLARLMAKGAAMNQDEAAAIALGE